MTATQQTPFQETTFSKIEDKEMADFERRIAYFFGAQNIQPIADAYIGALQVLEELGPDAAKQVYAEKMLPFLELAYVEISAQTSLEFDVKRAAELELILIIAQSEQQEFEVIVQIMIELYQLIFNSTSFNVCRASMLRTFLYQYKVQTLKSENGLSELDQQVMLTLADASEDLLNELTNPGE